MLGFLMVVPMFQCSSSKTKREETLTEWSGRRPRLTALAAFQRKYRRHLDRWNIGSRGPDGQKDENSHDAIRGGLLPPFTTENTLSNPPEHPLAWRENHPPRAPTGE